MTRVTKSMAALLVGKLETLGGSPEQLVRALQGGVSSANRLIGNSYDTAAQTRLMKLTNMVVVHPLYALRCVRSWLWAYAPLRPPER